MTITILDTNKEADKLLRNKTLSNLITSETTDVMWRYRNGIYLPDAEITIRKLLPKISRHQVNEIIDKIKRRTYRPEPLFNQINKVALQNKTLNLDSMKVELHDPKNLLTRSIPVRYDPNATCPNIENMLNKMFTPQEVQTIYEMIGYALLPRKALKALFFITGGSDTGKSTLTSVIKSFLGSENCAGYGIHVYQPNAEKYALAYINGKMVNIGDDISNRQLNDVTILKWLTGGQVSITVRQIYQAPQEIDQLPLNIFCANDLPIVPNDDAFYTRCIILESKHKFKKSNQKNVLAKLTGTKELSGLLNKVIAHLPNLMKRGRFIQQLKATNVKSTWHRLSKTVIPEFVLNHIQLDTNGMVAKRDVYVKYEEFCKQKNKQPKAQNQFGRIFVSHLNGQIPNTVGTKKIGRVNHYLGITLK